MKISRTVRALLRSIQWPARQLFLTMTLCLTSELFLAGEALSGQSGIRINEVDVTAAADETGDPSAPYIIFSNLGLRDDPYNTSTFFVRPIVGREVNQMSEEWEAIRFVPQVDVQATVLEAAVGYISGIKLVQLGIYNNNPLPYDMPGTLLPGGQESTTDIPNLDECCQLARVTLSAPGVTLTAGTTYWLVASTDDVNGVGFNGAWHLSHFGESAVLAPATLPWILAFSQWPAARISGMRLQTLGPLNAEQQENIPLQIGASGRLKIFSNLNRFFSEPYFPGSGRSIYGDMVPFYTEVWCALPFTPRANVQAKILSAALGHYSGTNRINLGVYSDSDGLPDSPLPGGQGSLIDLPDSGDCCDFATLRLPGEGVALTGGTKYWLVASPDNVNAPDFTGKWLDSTNDLCAHLLLPHSNQVWSPFSGLWMAAQIAGQGE